MNIAPLLVECKYVPSSLPHSTQIQSDNVNIRRKRKSQQMFKRKFDNMEKTVSIDGRKVKLHKKESNTKSVYVRLMSLITMAIFCRFCVRFSLLTYLCDGGGWRTRRTTHLHTQTHLLVRTSVRNDFYPLGMSGVNISPSVRSLGPLEVSQQRRSDSGE